MGRYFPDAVVCGLRRHDQGIIPESGLAIEASDRLVLLAPSAQQRCVAPTAAYEPCLVGSAYTADSVVRPDGQVRLAPSVDGPKVVLVRLGGLEKALEAC